MAYQSKGYPLGAACRQALRDGKLRRERNVWRSGSRIYNSRIAMALQDRGLLRPDLEADPSGGVLIRTEAGDREV